MQGKKVSLLKAFKLKKKICLKRALAWLLVYGAPARGAACMVAEARDWPTDSFPARYVLSPHFIDAEMEIER